MNGVAVRRTNYMHDNGLHWIQYGGFDIGVLVVGGQIFALFMGKGDIDPDLYRRVPTRKAPWQRAYN